jgi:hypothetical protein
MHQWNLFTITRRYLPTMTVLTLLWATNSSAVVDIDPGQTSAPLQAEGCIDSSGSLLSGVFGECLDGCLSNCDLAANTAEASLDVSNFTIGKKFVSTTIYTDFTLSAGSIPNTVLDATVAYIAEWAGGWTLGGVFTGFNDVQSVMSLTAYDLTAGGTVIGKATFHTMTTDGFIGIDIIDIGFGLDNGSEANTIAVRLTRGHSYRIGLTLRCEGKGALNATVILDYLAGGWGLWWNNLTVSVGVDLAEEIERLRRDLENHTHTYLTGRGEGHNNTEAETSPAIIMDEDTLSTRELNQLPDDGAGLARLPIKSVVLRNYPNPFNPATTISYTVPEPSIVNIKVYNTLGRLVQTLVSEHQAAGEHTVLFDASDLPSGVYFYRLIAGGYVETRRLTLLK